LVLFAGFLLNIHVFAQWDDYDDYDDDYDQPAAAAPKASTSPKASSSTSSSSSVTDITVKNPGSEEVTEEKLTLPNNQPIYLYFYNNVQNAPAAEAAPVETKAEATPVEPPVYTPLFSMEEKYNPPPPPPPSPPVEYRYIPTPPVEYWYIPPPAVEYRYVPPPPEPPRVNVRVIPGLPDPNSRKVYRLQVGSYSVHSTADRIAQQLRAAGLQAGIEYYNSLQRVLVLGVRAADAASVVQTLGLMGFEEVWIRE